MSQKIIWKDAQRMTCLPGVRFIHLPTYADDRGSLIEFWRSDEQWFSPEMGYFSTTLPGKTRGPHEHKRQSDCFIFVTPGMRLFLWENRPKYVTTSAMAEERLRWSGLVPWPDGPAVCKVIIPPGVVHAYQNQGDAPASVINIPDELYRGQGKSWPVDEIRHEGKEDSPFKLW